ncbi:MAG TPA: fumarylacetoacetate hydrolase family protein [Gemmataceae bacterium]|jgi:2-dehydro-3-deoxy-D-arabinonate dehydratase|nr:fumarylacetoacetate hydrolase family protein [Gemmataceae bacterium]
MQLCKFQLVDGEVGVGAVREGRVHQIAPTETPSMLRLSDVLDLIDRGADIGDLSEDRAQSYALEDVTLLPPIDSQEVWAAGVTYKRSQEARERESAGAARFYDLVYSALRPELFLKATARRVVGTGQSVRIRRDSKWSVPEPELALMISPRMRIVGYTIGNDMSARDIEGENPLYLPQAKIYDGSCSLGPLITLPRAMPPLHEVGIRLRIERAGRSVFEGSTSLAAMNRKLEDLVFWLGQENSLPDGAVLLTGTGIVPPDDFALAHGDLVTIEIDGIGRLVNPVEQL